MPYIKEVFNPRDLEYAKHVVLSSDPLRPNKFAEETDFIVDFLLREKLVTSASHVLDFGCGMGRVAKRLVEIVGCPVVGTDFSDRMLEYAVEYVAHPGMFTALHVYTEQNIDVALALFVLQHVENPREEIAKIDTALKPGGYVVLLNEEKRFIPSAVDENAFVIWSDDGFSVENEMKKYFSNRGYFHYLHEEKPILSIWQKRTV